jgi:hypothetical protein
MYLHVNAYCRVQKTAKLRNGKRNVKVPCRLVLQTERKEPAAAMPLYFQNVIKQSTKATNR